MCSISDEMFMLAGFPHASMNTLFAGKSPSDPKTVWVNPVPACVVSSDQEKESPHSETNLQITISESK
jgi:hypothetical protein